MKSRIVFLIGIISSILYIYFVLYNISIFKNISQQKQELATTKTNLTIKDDLPTIEDVLATEKDVIESVEKNSEDNTIEKANIGNTQEEIEVISDNRISIPAFGFISTVDKNQIVALMSDRDEDGALAKAIKDICQKQECIKDLRYEKDVLDASWQTPIATIVQLIANKKIKDGSLFIENNCVKIEGTVDDKLTSKKIISVIKNLKEAKLKVENYSKDITADINIQKIKPKDIQINSDKNSAKQTEINEMLKANPIIFKKRSSRLTKQSKETLNKIVKILKKYSYKKIIVSGHTDSKGSKVFNQVLSQTRADTVMKFMKRKGIKSSKIESIAYGSQKPIQNDPKDPKNRRVEILIVGDDE